MFRICNFLFQLIFIFFLVLDPKVSLIYSGSNFPNFRIRSVFDNRAPKSWLEASSIYAVKNLYVENSRLSVYFEFQNIREGSVNSTKTYTLWNGDLLYKDYITKVNSRLKTL